VREVAAEYGFVGEVVDVGDTAEVLESVHQAGETDARFLRRLAAREEFEFFIDDSGFHWRPRNQASPPTHVLTWYSDPGRGDVMSVSVETDLVRRVGRVDVRGRDPLNKGPVEASACSSTVGRPTLGELVEVVDPETGTTSLQRRNATASAHPTAATSSDAASREAAARFRAAERDTVKLSMQVVGDPTLRAKAVVEVRGKGTATNCHGCIQKMDKNPQATPICYTRKCDVSPLMVEEVDTFIGLYNLLTSEIFKRQPLDLLAKANALDCDLDVFAFIGREVAAAESKGK
jgi:phage protein D